MPVRKVGTLPERDGGEQSRGLNGERVCSVARTKPVKVVSENIYIYIMARGVDF